jgi:hypothetical protein
VEKRKVMRISRQPFPVKLMIDQKQLENVESFKYLHSILTTDGRCTCEIKSRIVMTKAALNKKRTLSTSKIDLELWKKLVKCYILCWRRMEKISWTEHVRNEEVLLTVKEQRIMLHEISKQKANWIGHILHRNCLLQQVIEGRVKGGIEVTGRQGRRRRKLLHDLNTL